MSKPITKIELASFRGATTTFELSLDPAKDLTLLFGENGSGKSTIVDALDITINGGLGSLDYASLGQNPGQHVCAVGKLPTTLRSKVHSGPDSWTATMQGQAVCTSGPPARPRVKTLRKSMILQLVVAQPQGRYEALKRFVAVPVVEQSEEALRLRLKDTQDSIARLAADMRRQEKELETVWQLEDRPGPGSTAIEWAADKVNTGIAELNARLLRMNRLVDAIRSAIDAKTDYVSRVSKASEQAAVLSLTEQQIRDTPGVNAATAVQLIDSLSKAKSYVDAELNLDKCPTCLRPMPRGELAAIIDGQLSQLTELKKLNDQRNTATGTLATATANVVQAEGVLGKAIQDLQQAVASAEVAEVCGLSIVWPDWSGELPNTAVLADIAGQFEPVKVALETQREDIQRDVNQFNSVQQSYLGITGAIQATVDQKRICTGLQRAYEVVHAKRVLFVQGVLDSVSKEANRLFQTIHPGEDIALERLKMDPNRRGSVGQTGSFHGHTNVLPQALFSDSHLETLGFCVWLALAQSEGSEETVLLIDDVFTSVDSHHLGRVMDLLAAERPKCLQVIVATHSRLSYDRCKNAQGVQRIHLGEWTIAHGITAQGTPLVTEPLRKLVDSPILDRQAVSSTAGVLLEDVLDGLALHHKLSLPRNSQNLYTLGALVDACRKLFSCPNLTVEINRNWDRKEAPEDWQPSAAKEAFDGVCTLQYIRSMVGCHFNPLGAEIADADIRKFGRATIELAKALTCPNCGHLATKLTRDRQYLRCACHRQAIRMAPTSIP